MAEETLINQPDVIKERMTTPENKVEEPTGQPIPQNNPNIEIDPNTSGDIDNHEATKEHTRSTMALLFVLGFYAILFLCFIYAIAVGAKLSDLKDVLIAIIGALSGLIGFVVGYYYKSSQEL